MKTLLLKILTRYKAIVKIKILIYKSYTTAFIRQTQSVLADTHQHGFNNLPVFASIQKEKHNLFLTKNNNKINFAPEHIKNKLTLRQNKISL